MHCKRCATLEAELEFPEPSTPHVDFLSQEGFRRKIKSKTLGKAEPSFPVTVGASSWQGMSRLGYRLLLMNISQFPAKTSSRHKHFLIKNEEHEAVNKKYLERKASIPTGDDDHSAYMLGESVRDKGQKKKVSIYTLGLGSSSGIVPRRCTRVSTS